MEKLKNLNITETQIKFINSAISLKEHVIDFWINNEEFYQLFWVSKDIMLEEIDILSTNIDLLSC